MAVRSPAPAPPGRPGLSLAVHAAVLIAGIVCVFRPTLASHFTQMQTDPGDTVLNHYILEHSWLWLTSRGYPAELWSPPCFYPTRLTLAYSENLLGTAPLYWLLRLAAGPEVAYSLWMMAVCALTFAAMAWVLRRLGVSLVLGAFGAYLFAFGLPRVIQLGHQQLLPQMFAPLGVYACWRFLHGPDLRTFAGLLAATYLQTLASIYLGWFLFLGLAVFLAWYLAAGRDFLPGLAEFARRRWLPAFALLAAWAVLLALLLGVYREANRGFQRDWEECRYYSPDALDWLLPAPHGLPAAVLGVASKAETMERWICPGWVVLGLVALGLGAALARPAWLDPRARALVLASACTALTMAVLPLRDLGGGWLWSCVYEYVPGAAAIRGVSRIVLVVMLFGLVGGLLALEALRRAPVAWPRARTVLIGLTLLLGALEHVPVTLPSFAAASFYDPARALARRLNRGTATYLVPRPEQGWVGCQLAAMWAGLYANRPVVNGYSGRLPDAYPDQVMPPDQVFGWLAANTPPGELWQGRLLYVVPARDDKGYRTVLLQAVQGPVAPVARGGP